MSVEEIDFAKFLQFETDGTRRLRRDIYTDPALFDLEMKYIWEKSWIYVGHESQLPAVGDFLTTRLGRQPIMVVRNREGVLNGFINACRHRGATLCRSSRGNAKLFTCPYHSWTYNLQGKLVGVKSESTGGYPEGFAKAELGLTAIPKVASYKGFIFACLDPDVEGLDDFLGETRKMIDLLHDQGPSGLEILKGSSVYTYEGNWKLQLENGVDGYHASSVHANFMSTIRNRQATNAKGTQVKAMNIATTDVVSGGYDLGRGHCVIWGDWTNAGDRFNYVRRDEMIARIGEVRTKWAIERLRNMLIYPSVFVMDQASTQIRVVRPISVDRTEVEIFCIAPSGESAEDRRMRIRFYEDFFNASGMATPDDLSEFARCQQGYAAETSPWSDLSRGAAHEVIGPDEHAQKLGLDPFASGKGMEDETVLVGQYRRWVAMMTKGAKRCAAHG
jgi:benzoate/toluate 1,2-dioxygenase alpha subunit